MWPLACMNSNMKKNGTRSHNDETQPTLFPSRELDKVVVRLPDGMRDALKERAAATGRSMNAEIAHRLQITIDTDVEALRAQCDEKSKNLDDVTLHFRMQIEINKGLKDDIKEKDRKIKSLEAEIETILYEIIAHHDEIPDSLLIWADFMLRIRNTNIDWTEEKDVIEAINAGESAKDSQAVQRRVEMAKNTFNGKMEELRAAFNRVSSNKAIK